MSRSLVPPYISIHALRKESDVNAPITVNALDPFQSTLSVRRATSLPYGLPYTVIFQSTLSVRRATRHTQRLQRILDISIHALRKESDPRGYSKSLTR